MFKSAQYHNVEIFLKTFPANLGLGESRHSHGIKTERVDYDLSLLVFHLVIHHFKRLRIQTQRWS